MFKKHSRDPFFLLVWAVSFLLLTAVPGFCAKFSLTTIFPIDSCISTCQGLQDMQNDLSADYCLSRNIDCSMTNSANHPAGYSGSWTDGNGFEPIGSWFTPFTGNFDGKGYEIQNLYINRNGNGPSDDCVGLFGHISGSGIKDVGLTNVSIKGRYRVGGLIGYGSQVTITDCYVEDDGASPPNIPKIIGKDSVGVLAGGIDGGVFTQCHTVGEVNTTNSGWGYFGGLVGVLGDRSGSVTITNCYSEADVTGDIYSAGGLVGYVSGDNISITNCHSTGDINIKRIAGGLIGCIYGNTKITGSYSTGSVTSTESGDYFGGLVGYIEMADINKSYSTGAVTGGDYLGGLVGYLGRSGTEKKGYIHNSYATGAVTGGSSIGGLVGERSDITSPLKGLISNSYSTGSVSASSDPGGFIGKNNSHQISNSYWNTTTSDQSDGCGDDPLCAGATGELTADMKLQTTYTGWDFTDIWKIETSPNSYPCLKWQTGSCP